MEDNKQTPPVLLVKIKTGEVYENLNGLYFKNLGTGQEGEVTKEMAQKHLALPVKLNYMADKNPLLLHLIRELGLCMLMKEE